MRLDRFERGTRQVNGVAKRIQTATCGTCLARGEVNDATGTWHPPEAIAKKLVQRGWFIGKRSADDRCPKCNAARPTPAPKGDDEMVQPMARKELRPAGPPDPKILTATAERPSAAAASPVREPTREERRKIIDYLDGAYDTKAQRYLAEGSDKAAGAALDVPWRWVADLRAQLYGDHDRNEADEARQVNLTELYQRGQDLEAKALQLAGEVETYKLDVKRALA